MAITKIISDNEAAIKAAIRSNGQGAITGDLLQEKMLLLNRDLFGGEIEYSNHILLADVEKAVENMRLRIGSDLFNFFKEYLNDGTWQNNYIALYGGRNNAYIVGYMRIYLGSNRFGEAGIICCLLGCESNLLKFIVSPESSDMEDNYIRETTYRGEPRILSMRLPLQSETTFPDYNSMLEALGIVSSEWLQLTEGKYAFVENAYYDIPIIYSLQECTTGRIKIGYANSGAGSGVTWELSVSENQYKIYCYDNL